MNRKAICPRLLPLIALFVAGPVAAQNPSGVSIGSEALRIEIGGRLQTQFNTTTVFSEAPSELILRRVRLEFDVEVNDLISGAIDPEFAGDELTLKDAYLKLNFSPAFQVLTGQAYKPFGLIEQTSTTRILPIERGLRVRGLGAVDEYALVNDLQYSDRDIGVQVMGEPGFIPLGFRYQAGIFRGPLHGSSNIDDSYQYAARVTVQPMDVITIGGGWSSRHFLQVPVDETDPFERGHAFEVDLEVGTFAPGLHLLGEVAWGDAGPQDGDDFFGAQGWLAWRSEPVGRWLSAVEPIFRASYGEVDDGGGPTSTLLTPGLNVYFGGRNRFMLNYDFVLLGADVEDDTEGSFKAQIQLAF